MGVQQEQEGIGQKGKGHGAGHKPFSAQGKEQAYHNRGVLDWNTPFPGDATRIDAQLIAMMDVVVNQGCTIRIRHVCSAIYQKD